MEACAALDDVQGRTQDKGKERKPAWLPRGMQPVLEELPKWSLLAAVLQEIEEEIVRQEGLGVGQYLYILYYVRSDIRLQPSRKAQILCS